MKPRYQEVRGHPNLVRDTSSGAVLNINATSGSAAIKRKKKEKEVSDLQTDVSVLKSELTEIKSLLKSFLEKQQ